MGKLSQIERAARAQFGSRMAGLPDAPRKVVRLLASDVAIEVAGPVLRHSERLDQDALVENARTQGQAHLLAIFGRKVLDEAVTDVLVVGESARGFLFRPERRARASRISASTLVRKACDDGDSPCASGRAPTFRGRAWSSCSSTHRRP